MTKAKDISQYWALVTLRATVTELYGYLEQNKFQWLSWDAETLTGTAKVDMGGRDLMLRLVEPPDNVSIPGGRIWLLDSSIRCV